MNKGYSTYQKRLVECHDALEGIDDPAAFVHDAKEAIAWIHAVHRVGALEDLAAFLVAAKELIEARRLGNAGGIALALAKLDAAMEGKS